jgi:hypothetical protein
MHNQKLYETFDANWGGEGYPSYEVEMRAGAGQGTGQGAGSGSGTPAAPPTTSSPTTQPGTGTPAAGGAPASGNAPGSTTPSPGEGVPGASPAPQPGTSGQPGAEEPPDIRTLRTNYEKWNGLGSFDEVAALVNQQKEQTNSALLLAQELQYTEESVRASVKKYGPAKVLATLQEEKQRLLSGLTPEQQQQRQIRQEVDELRNWIADQRSETGVNKLHSEFTRLLSSHDEFKGKEITPEIRDTVYDLMVREMGTDPQALQNIMEGKVSDVAKFFDKGMNRYLSAFNSHSKLRGYGESNGEGGSGSNNPPPRRSAAAPRTNGNGNEEKLSLEDVITASPKARAKLKTMA